MDSGPHVIWIPTPWTSVLAISASCPLRPHWPHSCSYLLSLPHTRASLLLLPVPGMLFPQTSARFGPSLYIPAQVHSNIMRLFLDPSSKTSTAPLVLFSCPYHQQINFFSLSSHLHLTRAETW